METRTSVSTFSMLRFTAYDSDPNLKKFLDNHTPVESLVTLKVGAQVMLLKNLNVSTIVFHLLLLIEYAVCYTLQSGSKSWII